MNIFDILGPVMVGPSSSHTAGAVRIGYITRKLLGSRPVRADIGLAGSFAATGKGHGTDKALVAGLLGMKPDDMKIPRSFEIAGEEGLSFSFHEIRLAGAHPNTALLKVEGADGKCLEVQASSLGGGRIMVNQLNGLAVNCTGENPTLIVYHQDRPGHVTNVTAMLAGPGINIAALNLYREKKGGDAVMIIEVDQVVPVDIIQRMEARDGIRKVIYIEGEKSNG